MTTRNLLLLFLLLLSGLVRGQSRVVYQSTINGYPGNLVKSNPLPVLPGDTLTTLTGVGYYSSTGPMLPTQLQPRLIRQGLTVTVQWDSSVVWIAPLHKALPENGWYKVMANGQTIWNGPLVMSLMGTPVPPSPATIIAGINSQIAVLQDGLSALRANTVSLSAYSSNTLATAATLATFTAAISGLSSATASLATQIAQNSADIANRLLISTYASGTATQATRDAGQDVQIALKLPGSFSATQAGVDSGQNTSIAATNTALSAFTTNQATIDAGQNTGIANAQSTATAGLTLAQAALPTATYTTNRTADLLAATNPANIVQNATYRFASDTEKATWNGKQNALGFTPYNSTNPAGYISLTALSASAPLSYNAGAFSIAQASGSVSGFLSSGDYGTLFSHVASTANPHGTTAAQVGLGNVNNTSDASKPVSTATQTALDLKANQSTTYTQSQVTTLLQGYYLPVTVANKALATSAATGSQPKIIKVLVDESDSNRANNKYIYDGDNQPLGYPLF